MIRQYQARHESCEINERVRVVCPTMQAHVDEGTIGVILNEFMRDVWSFLEVFAIDLIIGVI